jgi:hypothetical protein
LPQEQLLRFGHSIFDLSDTSKAVNSTFDSWRLATPERYVLLNKLSGQSLLYESGDWRAERPLHEEKLRLRLENRLKAYLQYFHNGLNDNDWPQWNRRQ